MRRNGGRAFVKSATPYPVSGGEKRVRRVCSMCGRYLFTVGQRAEIQQIIQEVQERAGRKVKTGEISMKNRLEKSIIAS